MFDIFQISHRITPIHDPDQCSNIAAKNVTTTSPKPMVNRSNFTFWTFWSRIYRGTSTQIVTFLPAKNVTSTSLKPMEIVATFNFDL